MIKSFKIFSLLILIFSISSIFVFGQKKVVHPIKPKDFNGLGITNDLKVLAEGSHSKVETPFVFIARDEKTYAQLKNLVEGLPESVDFQNSAVVAGFGGERSSGGWTVEIRKADKKVLVGLKAPEKGMMTTQEITTPFKVSLIQLDENGLLPLDISAIFLLNAQNFEVTKGDFGFSGGFAGIHKNFKASGSIKILTFGDNTTVFFDLKELAEKAGRKLSDISSGTIKDGNLEVSKVEAGSFVDKPNPPFSVRGTIKNKLLSLNFEPLPSTVSDGYAGTGILEAMLR